MDILSDQFGAPARAIIIVGGLTMLALAALMYRRWRLERGKAGQLVGVGGAWQGPNGFLYVGGALLALGVATVLCGVISPLGVAAPQVALISATPTLTLTLTPTSTPITRTLTATSAPPPSTRTPASTSTRIPTSTSTRTPTRTSTRIPSPTASHTPPPTVRPLPQVFILDTTFKATKCGSPGARATYTVHIEGSTIRMDHANGRNKYEGTINADSREFKMNGITNIGGGLSEVFEGKLNPGESFFDVFLELTTYTIKGQPCEEVWQVEGQGRQP